MSSNPQNLKSILSKIDADSCPNHLNFHIHTQFSDGSLDPISLLEQASNIGLKHLAVTDHHSIQAYRLMKVFLDSNTDSSKTYPNIWTGIEISCTLRKCLVHVLGLGFTLDNKTLNIYSQGESVIGNALNAENVINSIHEAGGLAILAHPARYRLPYYELIEKAYDLGIDGAEAWYDYDMNTKWVPSPFICEKIDLQLKSIGLLSTCGTDSHGLSLLGR